MNMRMKKVAMGTCPDEAYHAHVKNIQRLKHRIDAKSAPISRDDMDLMYCLLGELQVQIRMREKQKLDVTEGRRIYHELGGLDAWNVRYES